MDTLLIQVSFTNVSNCEEQNLIYQVFTLVSFLLGVQLEVTYK